MKLVSGKCPNCGANVELDSNLTQTYCAYCGSKISVEESVEKLKIELSGKIEIDGINSLRKLYQNAESYMKIKDYSYAYSTYSSIINNNPEELEAYKGALLALSQNMERPGKSVIYPEEHYPSGCDSIFDQYIHYIVTLDKDKKYKDFIDSFNIHRQKASQEEADMNKSNDFSSLTYSIFHTSHDNTTSSKIDQCRRAATLYRELNNEYKQQYKDTMAKIQEYIDDYDRPISFSGTLKALLKIGFGILAFIFLSSLFFLLIYYMFGGK